MDDDDREPTAENGTEDDGPPAPEDFEDDPAREPDDPRLKDIKGG